MIPSWELFALSGLADSICNLPLLIFDGIVTHAVNIARLSCYDPTRMTAGETQHRIRVGLDGYERSFRAFQ